MRLVTSFDLVNELIFVDAMLVGRLGRVAARLVLDTGASYTTIVPTLAEAVGYSPSDGVRRSIVHTATGVERGYFVKTVELRALGFVAEGIPIDVIDLHQDIDGLIGMNFLNRFNFEVRPIERRILVELIAS